MATVNTIGNGKVNINRFYGASRLVARDSVSLDSIFDQGNLKNAELAAPIYLQRGDLLYFVGDTVSSKGEVVVTSFDGTSGQKLRYLIPWIFVRVRRKDRWIGYKASPAALIYSRPTRVYKGVDCFKPIERIGGVDVSDIKTLLPALKEGVCLRVTFVFDEWVNNTDEKRPHPVARYMFEEVSKDDIPEQ